MKPGVKHDPESEENVQYSYYTFLHYMCFLLMFCVAFMDKAKSERG